MPRTPWVDRRFDFSLPADAFPVQLARLAAGPDLVDTVLVGVPHAAMGRRVDGAWSILDHVGHLADLDDLLVGRIADFRDGRPELRAADMSNRRTEEARHDRRPAEEVLDRFRETREGTIALLRTITPEEVELRARHPRLDVEVRPIDMVEFFAEHDAHHLDTIEELARRVRQG